MVRLELLKATAVRSIPRLWGQRVRARVPRALRTRWARLQPPPLLLPPPPPPLLPLLLMLLRPRLMPLRLLLILPRLLLSPVSSQNEGEGGGGAGFEQRYHLDRS